MEPVNTWAMLTLSLGLAMLLGPAVARIAAKRSAQQPTDAHPQEEKKLVNYVLNNPTAWVRVSTIEPQDFTDPGCAQVWAAFKSLTVNVPTPETEKESDIEKAAAAIPVNIAAKVQTLVSSEHYKTLIEAETPNMKEALAAGQRILDASYDRQNYQGRVAVLQDADGNYYRPEETSSTTRTLLITGAVALSSVAAWATVTLSPLNGPAALSAWIILLTLGASGVLWASVDIDTLYIDTRTYWPVTAVLWLATAATLWLDGKPQQLLSGVIVFSAVLILFEGSNLIYRLIRKRNGMGGGDTKLALATIAIPTAIVGSWTYGYTIVLSALTLAIAGWVMTRLGGQGGKNIPFAFGPYLAVAWCASALAQHAATYLTGGA